MTYVVTLLVVLALVGPLASPAGAVTVTETVSGSTAVGGDKVNINTAGVKDLMTLAGVSRGVAEKIVKYRDQNGGFKRPQDLRKVDGVDPAVWERNRQRIVVK
jgi:competence protein ComEA